MVSDLQDLITNKKLEQLEVFDQKVWFESELAPRDFTAQMLQKVRRRGKYIIYDFADRFLCQHLRMTGKMLPADSEQLPQPIAEQRGSNLQIRLGMRFAGVGELYFFDQRRFGTFTAVRDLDQFLSKKRLAPELITDGVSKIDDSKSLKHFINKFNTSRPVKSLLLDQSAISGVGNIYADESLHLTGIHPNTAANDLSKKQQEELYRNAITVMQKAIAKRGTSAQDYLDVNGNPGTFKQYLNVYRRTGESCKSCEAGEIERTKIAGRSSHYCPNCQPIKV